MLAALAAFIAIATFAVPQPSTAGAATLSLSVSPPSPAAGGPVSINASGTADGDGTVSFYQPAGDECGPIAPAVPAGATPEQLAADKPWFSAAVTGGQAYSVGAIAGQGNYLSTAPGIYIVCGYLLGSDGRTQAAASLQYTVKGPTLPVIAASFSARPQTPLHSRVLRVSARCNQACQSKVVAYLLAGGRTYRLAAGVALMGSGNFGLDPTTAELDLPLGSRSLKLMRTTLHRHQSAKIKLVCTAQGDGADQTVSSRTLELRLTG